MAHTLKSSASGAYRLALIYFTAPQWPTSTSCSQRCAVYSINICACVRETHHAHEASDVNPTSELSFEYGPPGTPETVKLTLEADNSSDGPAKVFEAQHLCAVLVNEDVVRSLAPAYELMFMVIAPSGNSSEKYAAQTPASTVGAQPVATQVAVDIADLLLGQTQVKHDWPSEQHAMPAVLAAAFDRFSVTVTTRKHKPEDSELPVSELQLTPFLPPGLNEQLSPIVLHVHRAVSLPDLPATTTQLDTGCYRCCLYLLL